MVHRNEEIDSPSGKTEVVEIGDEEVELQKMDMRDAYSYQSLLDNIVTKVELVKDREDAKNFLNGDLELTKDEEFTRRYESLKNRYASDAISIQEFEKQLSELMDEFDDIVGRENFSEEVLEGEDVLEENESEEREGEDESLLGWS